MPWCPICNTEFRPGFTRCSDCNVQLVDQLPPPLPHDDSPEVLLASFEDSFMAEQAVALLQDNGIPVLRKSPGTGDFMEVYMGRSMYGADLYVTPELYESARDLLADLTPAALPPEAWDAPESTEPPELPPFNYDLLYRILAILLLLAFLPGAIAGYQNMRNLMRLLMGN